MDSLGAVGAPLGCSALLLGTSDEAALNIALHLNSAWDLVCLARACKRFSVLCICAPPPERLPWGRLLPLNPAAWQPHLLTEPRISLGRGRLRGDNCDVLLPNDHHYSRRHCLITRRVGADGATDTTLTNLSANGTWFHPCGEQSGTRIFRGEEVRLRGGDKFSLVLPADQASEKFGDSAAVFEYEDGASLPEPPPERLSMVEESARKWLERLRPEHLAWVPRRAYESQIGRMREVQQLLPGPLRLSPKHPTIVLSSDCFRGTSDLGSGYRGVATSAVMRAGRHYAECKVDVLDYMFFGLLPADAALTAGEAHGEDPVDHPGGCFYFSESGARWNGLGEAHWRGMSTARRGDIIGLLWDRSAGGRLEVFKNGRRLGVMQEAGLCGEYRWCVALFNCGDTAQIEAKDAPPDVLDEDEDEDDGEGGEQGGEDDAAANDEDDDDDHEH